MYRNRRSKPVAARGRLRRCTNGVSGIRSMIALHTTNGIICLVTGMLIIFLTKGTPLHRRVGFIYVVSLYMLCLVSFSIKDTTPFFRGFGMFHVMSLTSMATVSAGFLPVLRRKTQKNWYSKHFDYMLWSLILTIQYFVLLPPFAWLAKRAAGRDLLGWAPICPERNGSLKRQ